MKLPDVVLSYTITGKKDIALWEAAPDLLEAAVVAQVVLFNLQLVKTHEGTEAEDLVNKAQDLLLAAIAKAGGDKNE